jgi:hypothetical protein
MRCCESSDRLKTGCVLTEDRQGLLVSRSSVGQDNLVMQLAAGYEASWEYNVDMQGRKLALSVLGWGGVEYVISSERASVRARCGSGRGSF